MTNLRTLFRAASNETISLIRYRLPLLKGFLRFHDWTLHNVSQAIAQGNFYAAAVHAQACLLAISEGPLRWILWAVLGVRKTQKLDQMLSKKSALSKLPQEFKNALYGTGVRDRLSSQLDALEGNVGELTEEQLQRAGQIRSAINATSNLKLQDLRNALACFNFYIETDGTIVWWNKKGLENRLPIEWLYEYLSEITPSIKNGLIELIAHFELQSGQDNA